VRATSWLRGSTPAPAAAAAAPAGLLALLLLLLLPAAAAWRPGSLGRCSDLLPSAAVAAAAGGGGEELATEAPGVLGPVAAAAGAAGVALPKKPGANPDAGFTAAAAPIAAVAACRGAGVGTATAVGGTRAGSRASFAPSFTAPAVSAAASSCPSSSTARSAVRAASWASAPRHSCASCNSSGKRQAGQEGQGGVYGGVHTDQLTRRCRRLQAQRGASGSRRCGGEHLELLQCDMDFGLVEEGGGVLRHRSQHSLIILRGATGKQACQQ
jgi:hypothetical protein